MKKKVKVSGADMTSLRNGRKYVGRGMARWVGEGECEIAMIEADPRVRCQLNRLGEVSVTVNKQTEISAINDARPGMPVLPIIGYDRRTNGRRV